VASYRLLIKPSAAKELRALPANDRKRVVTKIEGLASDPRPPGTEKLSGAEKYRLRQGDYRVLYSVDDAEKSLVIVKIGHRRDVYR
jgi:mRNA interferase RelE/StbE